MTDVLAVGAFTNLCNGYFLSSNALNQIAGFGAAGSHRIETAVEGAVAKHAGVASSTRSDANALDDKTGTDIDPRRCFGGRNALYVVGVGVLGWIGKTGYWRALTVGIQFGTIA